MIDELLSNRIIRAFDRTHVKLSTIDDDARERVSGAATMDFEMYVRFQELKSLAQAEERITFEEATTIFAVLGSSVEYFNRQPLSQRVVCTRLFAELLREHIRRHSR